MPSLRTEPSRASAGQTVSVVVPAYREVENLDELVHRISETLDRIDRLYEIIIVDDNSNDGTDREIERLQAEGLPVRLIQRVGERGLSSAVLRGFAESEGELLVCMDADLSHPPEALPGILNALESGSAEFVVGSRYVAGASTDEHWGWFRQLNSRVATWLARPFTRLRDPMAGFFALPRTVFHRSNQWDPIGYKIGLEILVKSGCRRVCEVPIHFADRRRGQSKLSWREQVNYLRHLVRLGRFKFGTVWQLAAFCAVGSVGAAIDLATLAWLLRAGVTLPVARGLSILLALACNFVANDRVTFGQRPPGRGRRFVQYLAACSLGSALNYLTTLLAPTMISALHGRPLWSATLGIVLGLIANFLIARNWVFNTSSR
ncbi:MAG: glycosyltransferase family 2 protein [Pirellulales bacterium]